MGRVSILGFPLRISPWLPLVLLALGRGAGTTAAVLAFVVGGIAAILVHELGHAVAAKAAGARDVRVALVALGGLTTYTDQPDSRWQRIGIAVAGPATGIAIGLPLLMIYLPMPDDTTGSQVMRALVFVTLGWAILNLLPVQPFDGGHILESLLPGSEETRVRLAAAISVAVALALAAVFYTLGTAWTTGVFVIVAGINLMSLLSARQPVTSAEDRSYAVLAQVLEGDLAAARATASAGRVDAAVEALLAALAGDPHAAVRLPRLAEERADPLRRSAALVHSVSLRDWEQVVAQTAAGEFPREIVVWAMGAARTSGEPAYAAAVGHAALGWDRDGGLAYLVARCWGAAGEPGRAYDSLAYARSLGWDDLAAAEREPDLAAARDLPAWAGLRT